MQGKDALFKVVGQPVAPRLYGLLDDVTTVEGRVVGMDAREGLFGGHGNIGAHHTNVPAAQVQVDGLQAFADTFGIARTALDEEGAVGPPYCCICSLLSPMSKVSFNSRIM